MSLRPLASLAVKLLGLYVVIQALPTLSLVIAAFTSPYLQQNGGQWTAALWNTTGGALQMLVGIALWWFADGLAAQMVKDDEGAPNLKIEWHSLAWGLLGLYFCVESASYLLRAAGILILINYPPNVLWQQPDNAGLAVREAFPALMRGLIGLWLLLGAKGLVRGVANLKNIGRDRNSL